ncbi:MAG: DsrE family protein [Armatimonadetes bacterium]|nr:DsrE family protein [Armatimonadota bacterium]
MAEEKKVVLAITREGMGQADPELQMRLMTNFLRVLATERQLPSAICLYGDGVRLAIEGSAALDGFRALEEMGVPIILCRTCLEYCGLTDFVAVGKIGTMSEIVGALFEADSIIGP